MIDEFLVQGLIRQIEKELGEPLGAECETLIFLALTHIDSPSADEKHETFNQMQSLESKARKFAIEKNDFQITLASTDKFMRIKIHKDETGQFHPQVTKNLLEREINDNDIPNVKQVIAHMHANKKPVIGFLGGVRQATPNKIIQLSNKTLTELIGAYGHLAVLSAGYRGKNDGVYGTTRAAHDSTKLHPENAISLVVTPEVGKDDHHQHPFAMDYYGDTWGDDTPGLIAAADGLIVFSPYGLITELEIATAQKNNKPVVVINTDQHESYRVLERADSGFAYIKPLPCFNTPEEAVPFLQHALANQEFDKKSSLTPTTRSWFLNTSAQGSTSNFSFKTFRWDSKLSVDQFRGQFNEAGELEAKNGNSAGVASTNKLTLTKK